MGFLKTLLILILIYYVLKILMRFLTPFLIKKVVDKVQKKAEEQFGDRQQETDVQEGETVIDKAPKSSSIEQSKKDVGEYIDFEEVE